MIYQDILIINGDVVLDREGVPVLIQDRAVIAQDIKHAIIESNLALLLIGNQSQTSRADIKKQIELLVEEDLRIQPGTTKIEEYAMGDVWVFAETIEFGQIEVQL